MGRSSIYQGRPNAGDGGHLYDTYDTAGPEVREREDCSTFEGETNKQNSPLGSRKLA